MFRTPDGYQVSDSIKFKSVLVPELTKIHWDELPPVDALHLKSVVDGLFDKIRSGEISETIPVYDVSRSPISRLESMAAPRMLDIPHVRISRISPFPASTLQTIPEDLKNKLVRILDDCGGGSEIRMAAEQLRSGALGITQFIDSMQAVLFKNPDQFSAVMDALNSGRWAPGSGDSSHPMDIIKNQLMATVLYANLSHMEQVSEGVRGEVDGLTSRTIPEPIVRMLSGAFPNIPEINTAYIGRPIPTISRDPWGLKLPEQLLLDVSSDDPSVRAKAIGIIHHEARHLQQFFEMTQYLFEKIRSEESHGTASAKLRKFLAGSGISSDSGPVKAAEKAALDRVPRQIGTSSIEAMIDSEISGANRNICTANAEIQRMMHKTLGEINRAARSGDRDGLSRGCESLNILCDLTIHAVQSYHSLPDESDAFAIGNQVEARAVGPKHDKSMRDVENWRVGMSRSINALATAAAEDRLTRFSDLYRQFNGIVVLNEVFQ